MAFAPIKNNYTWQQLFIKDPLFKSATYTNTTGAAVTLSMGTWMGRVFAAPGTVLPTVSTAVDGSQYPRFVLDNNYTVANNATVTVGLCYSGWVNQNATSFYNGTDTMLTTVGAEGTGGGSYDDLITALSDVKFWPSLELSAYDNN